MLHEVFNLVRPLICFDVETTGLDPIHDRIIELGFQMFTSAGCTKEWRSLINPGRDIPAELTKEVHGISNENMLQCQECHLGREDCTCDHFHVVPTFAQLAPNFARGFSECDFAGKNVRFDLRFLSAEMKRANVPWNYLNARVIDAERLEQLAVPRSLSHLYEKYAGEKLVNSHQALADVRATTLVIASQMRKYSTLPRSLDLLHEAQWPGWIDPEGKFKFVKDVPCFGNWGKFAGRPMSDPEASKPGRNGDCYWDFIMSADFSAEVKELASRAKMGHYPQPKGTS